MVFKSGLSFAESKEIVQLFAEENAFIGYFLSFADLLAEMMNYGSHNFDNKCSAFQGIAIWAFLRVSKQELFDIADRL